MKGVIAGINPAALAQHAENQRADGGGDAPTGAPVAPLSVTPRGGGGGVHALTPLASTTSFQLPSRVLAPSPGAAVVDTQPRALTPRGGSSGGNGGGGIAPGGAALPPIVNPPLRRGGGP